MSFILDEIIASIIPDDIPDPVFVPQNAATTHMDWDSPDKAAVFTKFKRKCELLFKSYYKSVSKEE